MRPASSRCLPALLLLSAAAVAWADDEAQRLVSLLEAQPGATIADVGAGEGRWTVTLAAAVGTRGRVLATEVTEELLEQIRDRVAEAGLENVAVVAGDQRATGLPHACCDAILLRLVYHHFTDPALMRADLARALRPGGRLVLVETRPQAGWRRLEGVPERGGHGIEPEEVVADLLEAGFALVARHDSWNGDEDRYALVFRRAGEASEGK